MHPLAASSSASSYGYWAYLAVFALAAMGFAGIPGIGAAVIAGAAVAASQGKLNIAGVLVAAAIGCEAGGLLGYHVGDRWGRQIMEHPGRTLERRQRAVASGEALLQKWGRLAVFFTPSMVSGILKMKYSQFAVWNFLAGAVFVLSVGPAAYGAGKVSTGQNDPVSVGALVAGVVIGAVCVMLALRYRRRRLARRQQAAASLGPTEGVTRPG